MSTTTTAVFGELAKTHKDRHPITIQLRGELRLEAGDTRMEGRLPGRLGRALLAFLVLNRHRAVTRDELMGALWPAAVPRDPAARLEAYSSRQLVPDPLRKLPPLRSVFAREDRVALP